MKNSESNLELRKQALEELEESTELFKQALHLLEEGRNEELEQVRDVARAKRFHSAFLMRQAIRIEDLKD